MALTVSTKYDVFISWSVEKSVSHQMALALRDWLPNVIQTVSCFVSSDDIGPGEVWYNQLTSALEESTCGILCLTKEGVEKPWVLFEAGAMATKFERAKVIPLLIGIAPSDVQFPIAALQCKTLGKEGMWDVLRCINSAPLKTPLTEHVLRNSFEKWWPDLDNKIKAMQELPKMHRTAPRRSQDEKIDEILGIVRSLQKDDAALDPTWIEKEATPPPPFPDIYLKVIEQVRKRRPLITAWVQAAVYVSRGRDGLLNVYFPKEEIHSAESLRREATSKFLNDIVREFGCTGIKLHVME